MIRRRGVRRAVLLWLGIQICFLADGFGVAASSGSRRPVGGEDDKHLQAAERFAKSDIVGQKNCVTCHTIGSSGGTVGPILNQISNRRTEAWLRTWLKDPNAVKPGTRMPNFQFSAVEIDRIVGYLRDMKRDIDSWRILDTMKDPVDAGRALFEAYDCFACHRIGDEGRFIGPNLTWVGVRKSRSWERVWLRDPPAYKPGTFMPNFHLGDAEIEALTAYLHSLQGQDNDRSRKWESITNFILDARPRERGRLVAERLACWACHGEGLEGGAENPNAAPDGLVPAINSAYQDFAEDELKQLILNGSSPKKLDPKGPEPPFACPAWRAALTEAELADLLAYFESIVPESQKWEFK